MSRAARSALIGALLFAGAILGWFASAVLPPSPIAPFVGGAGGTPGGMAGMMGGGMPPTPVLLGQSVEHRFIDRVRAVGTARATQSIAVHPEASGRLTAIHVQPGDWVAAGTLLFEIDNVEQQARLTEAQARAADARSRYERNQAAASSVPRAQIEQSSHELAVAEAQLALAEIALDRTRAVAPFGGTVGLIGPSEGAMVSPETILTTLDDRSLMKVSFAVPERYLGALQEGMGVDARSAAYAERSFSGVVTALDSRVDEASRSLRVEAHIDNSDGSLRPGMFLTLGLELAPRELVAVPEDGLVVQGGDAFVFVVDADGIAHRQAVEIVQRQSGLIAVRGDIAPGLNIIVAGQTRARDGAPVRPIEDAAQAAAAATPPAPAAQEN